MSSQLNNPGWTKIIDLGKQLFDQTRQLTDVHLAADDLLVKLCGITIDTAQDIFSCRAVLWLSDTYFKNFLFRPQECQYLHMADTPLLQFAAQQPRFLLIGQNPDGSIWKADELLSVQPASQVVTPLWTVGKGQGDLLGLLLAERDDPALFDEPDYQLLSSMADVVAYAVQDAVHRITENWRQEQLKLVQQVSAQIVELRSVEQLAQRVTSLIQETFDYYYVSIYTLEPGKEVLQLRASACGSQQADEESCAQAPVVQLGHGIIGSAADTGQEILVDDVRNEERYGQLELLPETRSEMVLPLKTGNHLLGLLDIQSDQVSGFDDTDQTVLRALAGNIAVALEGSRLYSTLSQRASQLSIIHEVSNAITSILDTENLFAEVVRLIQKHFNFSLVHLFSLQKEQGKIFIEAGSTPVSFQLRQEGFSFDLDDPQGIIPWVARHGDTLVIHDVSQEPRYRPSVFFPAPIQSELTIPLRFGENVLGLLDIQSEALGAFGDEDRFVFEALADNIAVAMRNAALYRSEVWRRQAADSLREVAGLLSAEAGLEQVLRAILDELERILPLDLAAVWLLEEDEAGAVYGQKSLVLAASGGGCANELELAYGLRPDDLVFDQEDGSHSSYPPDAWLNEILLSDHPLIRPKNSPLDPLAAALQFSSDYSGIGIPLRVGAQNMGVLTLAHHAPGRYGSEARSMSEAFASYAAVAIENARLYESAHEQTFISTALLQVAEATRSQTDLTELLHTVIRITPMLSGVRACLLYILDEDGNLVPAAASGLTEAQQAEFEGWYFAPGDVPVLDRLLEERQPVLVSNQEENQRLTGLFMNGEQEPASQSAELYVLVPLLSHSALLGTFFVHYSMASTGQMGNINLEAVLDERLAIIQGIAHQTAIAVENIRLNKAQKEEAYVSVALLQVAQAVVSSNDLSEALGAIVRITPILVGVKRAVIFQRDEHQKVFQVTQSYNINREAEGRAYPEIEFPLLEAIRQTNSISAYPVKREYLASEDVLDSWSFLPPPDTEEVEDYLESQPCLLLGFPLSVKGRVLGILLVEEPDPAPTDAPGSGNANRRLRSKRMEIITGISQQAALAMQNDLLQREMVVQERMAREMQLARDIQRTFLPQIMPELPGWDLKVFWRTAREVGGDFYDFFDLPDGRMGFVMADVADKGMPAALFMTQVRTLVRATVQQVSQPEQVLSRVNDILAPDAPKGMFVTIVYAVLNLDSGELEYANAGHNPPILFRPATQEMTPFERTGMALGVLEGSVIEGRRVWLEPQDFLIMYTDGVTEAYSAAGEFFGEKRLREIIQSTASANDTTPDELDAMAILTAIDSAVADFVGDQVPADDLTLLVLKCDHD